MFASADEPNLAKVTDAGRGEGDPVVFATNELQIVVPAGNPLAITGLGGPRPAGRLSPLCPGGAVRALRREAFETGRAPACRRPAKRTNVKGVLTKVALGEADAGLVYVTDVLAADGVVEGVDLAADEQVGRRTRRSVLDDAPNPEAAAAFVAFLTGDEAQAILRGPASALP